MPQKILTLITTSLLFSSFIVAQKNFRDGLIVLNNQDTVKGLIDYREWYKNPVSISFKSSEKTELKRFRVSDISYFEVTGQERYQRFNVRISMDNEAIGNISDKDTSGKVDDVFLKIIQTGKNVTLFSYADELKRRLYILQNDETIPVELQNSVYMVDGQVKEEKQYRPLLLNIISRYLPGDGTTISLINDGSYSYGTVEEVCRRINGLTKENNPQQAKSRGSRIRLFAGVGINNGNLKMTNGNMYAGQTSGPFYFPVVQGGFDFFINPSVRRFYLRGQLQFTRYKTDAYILRDFTQYREKYYFWFKQTNVTFLPQLVFNVYNQESFKWFLAAGAGFNFSSYPLNEQKAIRESSTDTDVVINTKYLDPVKKFWMNLCFRSGVSIKNLEISFLYFPKSAVSGYAGFALNNSSAQLQLNYLFKR